MMVAQLPTVEQQENLSRQQKRDLERRYQKAARRLQKLVTRNDLPVTFDNTTITAYGNFGLFEALKQVIGFTDMLQQHLTVRRHHNCSYSAAELIDIMVDCAALGLLRFSHIGVLKHDPGYQKLMTPSSPSSAARKVPRWAITPATMAGLPTKPR